MRLISGSARGQRLFNPGRGKGINHIRPTSDKVREAIFNIIDGNFNNIAVLDLYAGTGALGIEALSRGCSKAVFVDKGPDAVRLIRRNLEKCGFADRAAVFRYDLAKRLFFLKKLRPESGFGLVFCDPPYRQGHSLKSLEIINRFDLLSNSGLLIIEEAKDVQLPEVSGSLDLVDRRIYGETAVCIFSKGIKREKP